MEQKKFPGQEAEENRLEAKSRMERRTRRYEQFYSWINNIPSSSYSAEIEKDPILEAEDKARLKTFLAERRARG